MTRPHKVTVLLYAASSFIFLSASRIPNGVFVSVCSAFSTFSDESLGLLATHLMCFDWTGVMYFGSRLKVSARRSANSYLLSRVAPAKCKIPFVLFSRVSIIISAMLMFSVGEFHWSVMILTPSFFLSLSSNHNAKLVFPAAGVEP